MESLFKVYYVPYNVDDYTGYPCFSLSKSELFHSKLLYSVCDDFGDENILVYNNVITNVDTFRDCIIFLCHYRDEVVDVPLTPFNNSNDFLDAFGEWNYNFFNDMFVRGGNLKYIFDFINGCNYLDIRIGLYLGCAYVASVIKGKKYDDFEGFINYNK